MLSVLRRVPWWAVGAVVATVAVVTGALPAPEARELAGRVLPVLGFVAALTVVAECCAVAGVFDAATDGAARLARGRRWALWLLLVLVAIASTVVLSLDTTAVLLTPLAIRAGRRVGGGDDRTAVFYALTVVALANTASLLLPVSNLTNLLADHRFATAGVGYVGVMWRPALVAIAVTVAVLAVRGRHRLTGAFEPGERYRPPDRTLLVATAAVVGAMAVGFVSGAPVWLVAGVAAVLLLGLGGWRRGRWPAPVGQLVPWRMLLVVGALFVLVETAQVRGLGDWVAGLAPAGTSTGPLLALAGLATGAANLLNNLPGYLVVEPAAGGDPTRLAAVLIGVGAGPLLTPWASLATVLWLERCRRMLTHVPVRGLLVQGLWLAPLCVLAGVLALG
ncbi:SLC13 family permease [Cellulomonas denverensis]|uniref:SLC13 family permease n=1 Tax=Cellulomonas denverensis TaxID=264297 RepID=UPI001A36C2FC|nr:SLC13 family permease [Cellulomonas denverensis]GIG26012.1 arsenic transporter [Cellulomonas denverensis]